MNKLENIKRVKCKICQKEFFKITNTHLWKAHQITDKEYYEKYPNEKQFNIKEDVKESIINNENNDYKNKAFQYYNNECERCGANNELEVHYRNGNHTNNDIENLEVLCKKCHVKIHNEINNLDKKFVGEKEIESGMQLMLYGLKKRFGLNLKDLNFTDTPKRVARAYMEIFEGINNKEGIKDILSTAFPSTYDGMIIIDNITAFSMCPHHFLPVEYRVSVAYISENKMLGISKLPRLIEMLAKQPILQEDFTEQITVTLMNELKAKGAMVQVYGKHMCMRMRGVKSPESVTITSSVKGIFTKAQVQAEFSALSKGVDWN